MAWVLLIGILLEACLVFHALYIKTKLTIKDFNQFSYKRRLRKLKEAGERLRLLALYGTAIFTGFFGGLLIFRVWSVLYVVVYTYIIFRCALFLISGILSIVRHKLIKRWLAK